jgi:phosphatidylethanolamine-binding protein
MVYLVCVQFLFLCCYSNGKDRSKFSTELFTNKYMLGDPVAGNFYIAEYDDYVPTLNAQLKD